VAAGSNDNVIEDNKVTGNTNGIVLVAGTTGNVVRRNIVVANPPVQVSVTFPQADGVDIRNGATPGTNTIEDNICLTAVNAACPDVDARGKKDKKDKKDK
jgi:parallel beta-helix repeat protein